MNAEAIKEFGKLGLGGIAVVGLISIMWKNSDNDGRRIEIEARRSEAIQEYMLRQTAAIERISAVYTNAPAP